mgnify:CR=1 FL=1
MHIAPGVEKFKSFSYYNGMRTFLFLSFAVGGYSLYFILCFIRRVIIMPVLVRVLRGVGGRPKILRGTRNTYFKVRVDGRWYDIVNEFDKFAEDHPDKVLSKEDAEASVKRLVRYLSRYLGCTSEAEPILIERFLTPFRGVDVVPPYDVEYQLVVKNESSETCYMWGMVFDLNNFYVTRRRRMFYEPCPLAVRPTTGLHEVRETKEGELIFTWNPSPKSINDIWGYYYMSKVVDPGGLLVIGPHTIRIYNHDPLVVFLAGVYPVIVSNEELPANDLAKTWLTAGVDIYYPEGPPTQTTDIPIYTTQRSPEGWGFRSYRRSWAPWLLLAVDVFG